MKSDLRQELFGIAANEKITLIRVIFIIIAVLFSIFINYAGSVLAEVVVFPLYLDSLLYFIYCVPYMYCGFCRKYRAA